MGSALMKYYRSWEKLILAVKYDLIKFNAVSVIPKVTESMWRRTAWSMVSSVHSTLMKRKYLLMHSSQVVWIICKCFQWHWCSSSSSIPVCLFSTRPHASLLTSVRLTRLQQQLEMSCTGYQCNKDSTTNFAISYTNDFTIVHRRIYHQCVFVLMRLRVIVIFDHQPLVT